MPVAGVLDSVRVRRGSRVHSGEILATLDASAEQAAADLALYKSTLQGPTLQAQAKIEFSQQKFARREQMAAEHLMARQESDDAQAELKQAQSELKTATENREVARLEYLQQKTQVELRTLRSPFDGVVVDQLLWPGEVFEPGSTKHAVLKLAKLDPLRVRIILPMQLFGKVRAGLPASLVLETRPDAPYPVKLKSVDPVVDAASGTFEVFVTLANRKLLIPAGVKCRATFEDSLKH